MTTTQEAGRMGGRAKAAADRQRYKDSHNQMRANMGLPPYRWSDDAVIEDSCETDGAGFIARVAKLFGMDRP